MEEWRRCPLSSIQGDQWWRPPVVLRPRQGSKRHHGGPAMLLDQTSEGGRLLVGGATVEDRRQACGVFQCSKGVTEARLL
jgi:hypothetical protein